MDTDGDGIPCEVAPSGVAEDATLLGGYPDDPAEMNDLDCVDLAISATETTAQATYDADPSDPNGLDRDGDGIACESSFSEASGTTFEDGSGMIAGTGGGPAPPGAEVAPVTPPSGADSPVFQPAEPDVAELPDTGGPAPALLLPVAGLLLATGLIGLTVSRRRT